MLFLTNRYNHKALNNDDDNDDDDNSICLTNDVFFCKEKYSEEEFNTTSACDDNVNDFNNKLLDADKHHDSLDTIWMQSSTSSAPHMELRITPAHHKEHHINTLFHCCPTQQITEGQYGSIVDNQFSLHDSDIPNENNINNNNNNSSSSSIYRVEITKERETGDRKSREQQRKHNAGWNADDGVGRPMLSRSEGKINLSKGLENDVVSTTLATSTSSTHNSTTTTALFVGRIKESITRFMNHHHHGGGVGNKDKKGTTMCKRRRSRSSTSITRSMKRNIIRRFSAGAAA